MGSLKSVRQNEEKSRRQKRFTKQAEGKLKKKNNGTIWCSSVIDTFQQKWTKYRPPKILRLAVS